MMKYVTILIGVIQLAAVILLFSLAPDTLTLLILSVMSAILALGFFLGIVPVMRFIAGFRRARKAVREASKVQTADATLLVMRQSGMFQQKNLEEAFQEYKDVVQRQNQAGEVLRDISEFISEDYLSIHSWQGLMVQIPGILTGLGILGTFIGLISGLGTLVFSSAEAAITSIALLITGIETAFYTSISGVILSILFNILYRILWNTMLREYGLFLDCYYKQVVPPTDVQTRRALHTGLKELMRRLDELPHGTTVHGGGALTGESGERLLMPQVVQAMEEGQFLFYLEPMVTMKTRRLVGAEALVRWRHESLGLLTPAAFLPVLERNAYVTKLDLYIWDKVCKTLRDWMDKGLRPLPITLNVSRADLHALDLPEVFSGLLKQYHLSPRALELDVPASACTSDEGVVTPMLSDLRAMGLKITLDGFNGDFLAFRDMNRLEADALKLDLRKLRGGNSESVLKESFAQARSLGIELTVSGVESAAQLVQLEKLGCVNGQGFYFYHPMPVEEFSELAGYQGDRI